MVRYPFDVLRAVSRVEPLTTNGKSDTYGCFEAFALRYRRVNATFYELIILDPLLRSFYPRPWKLRNFEPFK
jgi:hypothetical protein